jgi:hypothetical protein
VDPVLSGSASPFAFTTRAFKGTDRYTTDDLPQIDYIKIDCEGYELPILQGAEQTLRRYRPIMVLEDKKHKDVGHNQYHGAVDLLMAWGARRIQQIRSDVILTW